MSHDEIILARRDEDDGQRLSEDERTDLPRNAAGSTELADADLEHVVGGDPSPAPEPVFSERDGLLQ